MMPHFRMTSLLVIASLAGILAGCEDQQNVSRRAVVTQEMLAAFQATGGLLTELHGVPWPSATPGETVGTLRMPAGPAAKLRFLPIKPGKTHVGDGQRLVLHFNAQEGASAATNCQAKNQFETGQGSDSFTVVATFCEGEMWLVNATLDADLDEQDWLGYYLTMQELLAAMFPQGAG